MLFISFFKFIYSDNFDNIPLLSLDDFSDPSTYFIYIYYSKPDYDCPLCTKFNNKISEIPMKIKRINFYDNPYIASHLFQCIFPSFVIRHNKKRYIINVTGVDELFDIINNNKWKDIIPIHWIINTNSIITKIYAILFSIFYFLIEYTSEYLERVPYWVINGIMSFIIGYLVISLIGIFNIKSNNK